MRGYNSQQLADALDCIASCNFCDKTAPVGINIGGDIISITSVTIDDEGLIYINGDESELTKFQRKPIVEFIIEKSGSMS